MASAASGRNDPGFDAIQDRLAQPGPDLGALVSDVRARLELSDGVWAGG
jgi:hypothetical protein